MKEQLKGSLAGLEHVDFSSMFTKRPQGGNDDPTVMWYQMTKRYWKILAMIDERKLYQTTFVYFSQF